MKFVVCVVVIVACGGQSHGELDGSIVGGDSGRPDSGARDAGPVDAGDHDGDEGGQVPPDAGGDASASPEETPCVVRADCGRWVASDPFCTNGFCCLAFEEPSDCTCGTDTDCDSGYRCCETYGSPDHRTCSAADFCRGGL